jgi:CRP/FNR family cyclic AMP-dependent transcriptional regulator
MGYIMTDLSRPGLPSKGIIADLSEQDRLLLSDYGEFRIAKAGETLIEEGEAQEALFFIISGLVHVHSDEQTRRTLIARVGEGETIGEVNLFDPGIASASVTAKEQTELWRVTREDIDAFLTNYPEAGGRLLAAIVTQMCRRIRRMNERLAAKELEAGFHEFWH